MAERPLLSFIRPPNCLNEPHQGVSDRLHFLSARLTDFSVLSDTDALSPGLQSSHVQTTLSGGVAFSTDRREQERRDEDWVRRES